MTIDTVLLGASGQIGHRLLKTWGDNVLGTRCSKHLPGLVRFDAFSGCLGDLLADICEVKRCILLFGETSIDRCAKDRERSHALNVAATSRLIDELDEHSIMPVFISTDVVFDGRRGAYTEGDTPDPALTYGRQKLAVERHLAARNAPYLVVRLPKVICGDPEITSMFSAWRDEIAAGRIIRCAEDQVQSPIDLDDAVAAIQSLVEGGATGLYHVAGPEAWTRARLFEAFVASAQEYRDISPRWERCSIRDFDFAEARPLDTTLDISKFIGETGFTPRSIRETCRNFAHAAYSK